jgi:hypothetical protein
MATAAIFGAFMHGKHVLPALKIETKLHARPPRRDEGPSLAPVSGAFIALSADGAAGSAVRTRSVRQSFHAFGNDLAELHHLLAQSSVFYNIAMDAIAI